MGNIRSIGVLAIAPFKPFKLCVHRAHYSALEKRVIG